MAFRLLVVAAASSLLFVGCDEAPPAAATVATTQTSSTAGAATMSGTSVTTAPRERISLGAIPLSMEVPKGWQLQPGATKEIVLHGRTSAGEVDVLLATGPSIKADALRLMADQITKAAPLDGHTKNEVTQRDGMTIIQTIAPQTPPGAPPATDPDLVPINWNVQCIIAGDKLDLPVYELTFVGLSQSMLDKDEKFLRELISTLRFESQAGKPATR